MGRSKYSQNNVFKNDTFQVFQGQTIALYEDQISCDCVHKALHLNLFLAQSYHMTSEDMECITIHLKHLYLQYIISYILLTTQWPCVQSSNAQTDNSLSEKRYKLSLGLYLFKR